MDAEPFLKILHGFIKTDGHITLLHRGHALSLSQEGGIAAAEIMKGIDDGGRAAYFCYKNIDFHPYIPPYLSF